jgi:hypothetical protein
MQEAACPRCHGSASVSMEIVCANADGARSRGLGFGLRPRHCKGCLGPAALAAPFSACLSCGLVWSDMEPRSLRAFILARGDELARQHLDRLEQGPLRDLPDIDAARAIGAAIAEVDTLAIADSTAAVRRYRELRGVTWDQALRDVKAWPRLTRREKLELFGWTPKKTAGEVDPDFDGALP